MPCPHLMLLTSDAKTWMLTACHPDAICICALSSICACAGCGSWHLTVDVALHGHKQVIQGLIMPKGAFHCQLGVQVILRHMASQLSASLWEALS